MASGVKKTLEFLAGECQNVTTYDCFTGTNDFEQLIDIEINKSDNKPLIVLTDIKFGSVNQIIGKKLKNDDFYLISGFNLPLALSVVLAPESDLNYDYLSKLIEESKNEIVFMNNEIKNTLLQDDFF